MTFLELKEQIGKYLRYNFSVIVTLRNRNTLAQKLVTNLLNFKSKPNNALLKLFFESIDDSSIKELLNKLKFGHFNIALIITFDPKIQPIINILKKYKFRLKVFHIKFHTNRRYIIEILKDRGYKEPEQLINEILREDPNFLNEDYLNALAEAIEDSWDHIRKDEHLSKRLRIATYNKLIEKKYGAVLINMPEYIGNRMLVIRSIEELEPNYMKEMYRRPWPTALLIETNNVVHSEKLEKLLQQKLTSEKRTVLLFIGGHGKGKTWTITIALETLWKLGAPSLIFSWDKITPQEFESKLEKLKAKSPRKYRDVVIVIDQVNPYAIKYIYGTTIEKFNFGKIIMISAGGYPVQSFKQEIESKSIPLEIIEFEEYFEETRKKFNARRQEFGIEREVVNCYVDCIDVERYLKNLESYIKSKLINEILRMYKLNIDDYEIIRGRLEEHKKVLGDLLDRIYEQLAPASTMEAWLPEEYLEEAIGKEIEILIGLKDIESIKIQLKSLLRILKEKGFLEERDNAYKIFKAEIAQKIIEIKNIPDREILERQLKSKHTDLDFLTKFVWHHLSWCLDYLDECEMRLLDTEEFELTITPDLVLSKLHKVRHLNDITRFINTLLLLNYGNIGLDAEDLYDFLIKFPWLIQMIIGPESFDILYEKIARASLSELVDFLNIFGFYIWALNSKTKLKEIIYRQLSEAESRDEREFLEKLLSVIDSVNVIDMDWLTVLLKSEDFLKHKIKGSKPRVLGEFLVLLYHMNILETVFACEEIYELTYFEILKYSPREFSEFFDGLYWALSEEEFSEIINVNVFKNLLVCKIRDMQIREIAIFIRDLGKHLFRDKILDSLWRFLVSGICIESKILSAKLRDFVLLFEVLEEKNLLEKFLKTDLIESLLFEERIMKPKLLEADLEDIVKFFAMICMCGYSSLIEKNWVRSFIWSKEMLQKLRECIRKLKSKSLLDIRVFLSNMLSIPIFEELILKEKWLQELLKELLRVKLKREPLGNIVSFLNSISRFSFEKIMNHKWFQEPLQEKLRTKTLDDVALFLDNLSRSSAGVIINQKWFQELLRDALEEVTLDAIESFLYMLSGSFPEEIINQEWFQEILQEKFQEENLDDLASFLYMLPKCTVEEIISQEWFMSIIFSEEFWRRKLKGTSLSAINFFLNVIPRWLRSEIMKQPWFKTMVLSEEY